MQIPHLKKITRFFSGQGSFLDHSPLGRLQFSLSILLALLPVRLLGLFGCPPEYRFAFGLLFFTVFFWNREKLVPRLLESTGFQHIFFFFLRVDNLLCANLVFYSVSIVLACLFLNECEVEAFAFWYFFLWSGLSTYARLKEMLLTPIVEVSPASGGVEPPEKGLQRPEDLTWGYVVAMMSEKTRAFFGFSLRDRLRDRGVVAFPHAARRYMFTRACRHLMDHKDAYKMIAGGVSGAIGAGVLVAGAYRKTKESEARVKKIEEETRKINEETEKIKEETEKIREEAEKIKAEADAILYRAETDRMARVPQAKTGWFGSSNQAPTVQHSAKGTVARLKGLEETAKDTPQAPSLAKEEDLGAVFLSFFGF